MKPAALLLLFLVGCSTTPEVSQDYIDQMYMTVELAAYQTAKSSVAIQPETRENLQSAVDILAFIFDPDWNLPPTPKEVTQALQQCKLTELRTKSGALYLTEPIRFEGPDKKIQVVSKDDLDEVAYQVSQGFLRFLKPIDRRELNQ
jgi:hypothetical protein